MKPILFYTYTVFNLQMVYSLALYVTTWLMAGSWLAAVPTVVFFTFCRFDMTRVEFTVPLRERYLTGVYHLLISSVVPGTNLGQIFL